MQPIRCGKYTLLQRVSVGGMAEVFRAKRERDDRVFAIKRILPNVAEDAAFIQMFIVEARTASQLIHPNICEIYELGRQENTHFIAMEHIWGKDLLQVRNRQRTYLQPMPIAIAAFIMTRVLDGLDYAHRKCDRVGRPLELAHRDVSPHNVLVSYAGDVKVIDFGVAKVRSNRAATNDGQLKGKFAYMSPEQVRGKPIDRRSDIFAAGAVLYECLTNERLFTGDTDLSILDKVREVEVPSVRAVVPNLPDEMERILHKSIAKDVAQRYQWCSEMRADLAAFCEAVGPQDLAAFMAELFAVEIANERADIDDHVHGKPRAHPRAASAPIMDRGPATGSGSPPRTPPAPTAEMPSQLSRRVLAPAAEMPSQVSGSRPRTPPSPTTEMPSQPTPLPTPAMHAERRMHPETIETPFAGVEGTGAPSAQPDDSFDDEDATQSQSFEAVGDDHDPSEPRR